MRRAGLIGALLILIVLFFAVNMLASLTLPGARLDVTQGRVYTLTQGSRNIAKNFDKDEPVTLTLYYSSRLAQGNPDVQSHATRVRELLNEYARMSGGKIKVKFVDPEPSSEQEDVAQGLGVTPIPMSQSESMYFGLVGTNSTDTKEVIPFLDPRKDRFLEYDVSRLLYSLANPKKKVVGLISSLGINGGFSFNQQTRQPTRTPAWQIAEQIKGQFELRPLSGTQEAIPADVDVLMVVHPKALDDTTLFAIDQYILKGGRAMLFVDPFCESDEAAGQDPTARTSNLDKLFDAWGVEVPHGKIAADKEYAKQVMMGSQARPERVTYVGWIGIKPGSLTRDDPTTGQLTMVNFASSGLIKLKDVPPPAAGATPPAAKAHATINPLIQTSATAWIMPVEEILFQADPRQILEHYVAGKEALTLAARLTGEVESAFPNGVTSTDAAKPGKPAGVLKSEKPLNVIVVADVDMLSDNQWVRVQNFFGQSMTQKLADNGDFVVNALDNLSGSSDLITVRARRGEARPFDLVDKMQRNAEERYASEQKALSTKLQETQTKLGELQAKKGQDQNSFVLSAEQQAEVEKFRTEMLSTRKQLRNVQLNLRKDIETLGTKLKFINIGLIPLLVALGALGLGALRASRRRRTVKRA